MKVTIESLTVRLLTTLENMNSISGIGHTNALGLVRIIEHLEKGGGVLLKTGDKNPHHKESVVCIDPHDSTSYNCYDYARTQLVSDLVLFRLYAPKPSAMFIIRGQDPHKGSLAFNGGFCDIQNGENIDKTVIREMLEEVMANPENTGLTEAQLDTKADEMLRSGGKYHRCTFRSNAERDPRGHNTTCVYVGYVSEEPEELAKYMPGDDAAGLLWLPIDALNASLNGDDIPILNHLQGEIETSTKAGETKRVDVLKTCVETFGESNFAFDHEDILMEVLIKEGLR